MASTSATSRSLAPGAFRAILILGLAGAVALIIVSFIAASNLEDPFHPRFHAGSAVAMLVLAWLAAGRGPATLARRALATAFLLMATAFLVEGVGGFGFDHHGRNALAVAHDLGLGLTALSMLAAAALIGVATGSFIGARSSSRGLSVLVGAGAGLLGLLFVKTMIGM
ncbi:MAG: hypothetical protein EPO00_06455 [Chloroflexota bacterium]|nr:MAG: hypothetical protein EPO00_06455 [Chloroflexota bacterium]